MASNTATVTSTSVQAGTSATLNRRERAKSSTAPANVAATNTPNAPNGDLKVPETLRQLAEKKYKHVAVVHSKPRTSILSHDSVAAPSFLGFRNLMVLTLIVGNLRLMIENFRKYGVLICLACHDYSKQDLILGAATYFLIPCHLFAAYCIELAAAQQARLSVKTNKPRDGTMTPTEDDHKKLKRAWKLIAWAHGINATLCLGITSAIVYYYIHHPLIGTISEIHAIVVWLKTASYALTNRDLRHAYLHPSKNQEDLLPEIYASCRYPQNITLRNLSYFWWAPTLVYQPVYPRTDKIRWIFVAKRLGEVVTLSAFIWIASAQYAAPLLMNSLDKMASLDIVSVVERVMKLSTVSLVVWLAGFFALFQSFLNALAEILRFADREFYTDWWNSPSLGTYWRTWNKPVHAFMKRHVYMPLRGRGWSHGMASIYVFVFSGLLHELLVGIPTHNVIGIAFIGMMAQIPLIIVTTPLEKMNGHYWQMLGNSIFWISFTLIGQPLAALLYFFAWQAKYGSVSKLAMAKV